MVQLYRRKGADALVNAQTASDQLQSDVAVLPGGGYVIVWTDASTFGGDPNGTAVVGQRFDEQGNKAGGEFLVNGTLAGNQSSPTVAALASGRFVVTWTDSSATGGDTSSFAVRAQLFEANGTPVGGEFLVNTVTSGNQSTSSVAALASGGFAISWSDGSALGNDTSGFGIKAQLFDSSGAKVGGEISVNSTTAGSQNNSSIAGLASGGFAIAWISAGNATMLQLFDPTGARVGSEVQANGVNGLNFSRANIVALADGLVVTWMRQNSDFVSGTDVVGQRFDLTGAKVGTEFVVHSGLAGNQGVPDAVALPGGGFMITWQGTEEGGTAGNVFGQIFDSAGARVGIEFVVSSVVSGDQLSPKAAAMPSGDIVVTWTDASRTGADFSGYAIRSQILTPSTGPSTGIEISARVLETAIENLAAATLSANGAVNSGYTYELLDDAGGAFRLEGNRLVVADNNRLDFETHPTMSIVVRATDVNGLVFTGGVTVEISDVIREKRFGAEPEFQVNVDQSQWEGDPTVVALSTGGFALFWRQQASGSEEGGNFVRVFNSAGAPTSGDILLGTGAWGDFPVAPLAGGGFLTARDPAASNGIVVQAWNSGGQPVGPETILGAIPMQQASRPDLVQLTSGGYVVSWAKSNGGIDGQLFDASGAPVGGVLTLANAYAQPPFKLAAAPGGGFVAVWEVTPAEFAGAPYQIKAQFFDSAGAPTGPAVFTPLGNPNITGLDVIALAGGGYAVGWREPSGTAAPPGMANYLIKVQLIDAGGSAVGGPQLVSGFTAYLQATGEFALEAHPSGGFILTWPAQDPQDLSRQSLYGALFDSLGQRVGSPFESIGDGSAASIAVLADGTFVAAYVGNDSYGSGVFARLYRPTDSPDNNGNDVLIGDSAANLLEGGAGDDQIYGLGGNDDLLGGSDQDRLEGGEGNDRLRGDSGDDVLVGGAGDDDYDGGEGVDTLDFSGETEVTVNLTTNSGVFSNSPLATRPLNPGEAFDGFGHYEAVSGIENLILTSGDDFAVGGDEANRFEGGAGDDALSGGGGNDVLLGGAGFDGLVGGAGDDSIEGGGDDDELVGGEGDDRLDGGSGIDTAGYSAAAAAVTVSLMLPGAAQNTGGAGVDTLIGIENLTGSAFGDTLTGNDLANVLNGGGGADTMLGRDGDDTYFVNEAGDAVEELAGQGVDTIRTSLTVYSLVGLPNVENLRTTGPATARDFRGNSGNNVITGGAGSDILRLYDGGDDTVFGGAGADNIFFIGSLTSADVVNGGSNTDTLVLQGPYGSLTLTANITEIENISILAGSNTAFGEPGTNRYDYVLTTNNANFAAGVQARINGAALLEGEDFTFDGSAETDASFVVYGGKGKDTLTGGLGNDIFFYAEERFASGDTVNGGPGYDGMFLRGNYTIDFNAPGYTGLFTNIENLTLTSATDERYARGGGTEFDYNLTLSNAIVKPGETLTVSGALLMASETMVLDASQESDGFLRLFGGKADDTLKGGGQADLLLGNLGADMLTGNGGADTFRFDSTADSNSGSMDQILDFTPGTDKIDLGRVDANALTAGDQAFSWIGSNAFSGTAGQLRAAQSGGSWFLEGDTNGDGVADLVIAVTLQGSTPLAAGDFLL
jgi:Ca2+-binding RTX toxin-like protein